MKKMCTAEFQDTREGVKGVKDSKGMWDLKRERGLEKERDRERHQCQKNEKKRREGLIEYKVIEKRAVSQEKGLMTTDNL